MIDVGNLVIDLGAINWLAVVAATIFAMAFRDALLHAVRRGKRVDGPDRHDSGGDGRAR